MELRAAAALGRRCGPPPTLAIILGSGFGNALADFPATDAVPYSDLPGFPRPGVLGHPGRAQIAEIAGTRVLLLHGRAHFYEGYSLAEVTLPIRALAAFGIKVLLVTNAAGGISRRFRPGELMLVRDHINFMGVNPLRGHEGRVADRFVDLSLAYDLELRQRLTAAARKCGIRLRQGIFLAVTGPSYETPAEVRAFARLGADAVGMSTVPEVIVARQCGLRVASISCITNPAAGVGKGPLSHREVLATAARSAHEAAYLIQTFVRHLPETGL